MLDDDIQYLGSRIKPRDNPLYPQRNVTGAALHIEKSDGNDPYVLTFNRDNSSTVHIGRRPGTEIESRTLDQEKGRAMFRCAVVSRRHAKIAFSDSGNVYLIDLESHHGTHVRKPGETSSRMLEPEVPTPLSDGDIITFGKSVGRSEEMVRPVVARVQLLYSGPSTSTIKPLVVPDSSPTMANRSHSGRYGLHSPSSSSSDEAYNGQSDVYSDIEEIPPPPSAPVAPASQAESKPESHIGRAFEVLKRLLPPTSIPPISAKAPGRDVSPRLEEQSPVNSVSSSPDSSLCPSPSDLPPLWSLPASGPSPFPLLPRYPSISSIDFPHNFFDLPPIINAMSDGNRSRSESPMDLASPSPPPAEQEPHVIGAWGDYASPSSCLSSSEPESIATPADNGAAGSNQLAEMDAVAVAQQHEEEHEAEANAVDNKDPSSSSSVKEKEKEKETIDTSSFVTKVEYEDLRSKYARLQNEIDGLQTQRRKYKSKFNANVHTVTDKFHELEDKMNDMNAQCTLFMDQIETVTYGDVPDLQTRIDDLLDEHDAGQMEVGKLRRRIVECEEKVAMKEAEWRERDSEMKEDKEKVQRYLDTLRGLVEEMKALRTTTEGEVKAELETLRQLRESIAKEATVSTSLKRKRNIEDEDGDRDDYDTTNGTTTPSSSSSTHRDTPAEGDVTSTSLAPAPNCDLEFQIPQPLPPDRPPRRKRVRKVVSIAAQTATAVTMGAVAAWAALAYS